jgi:hypothetical protein
MVLDSYDLTGWIDPASLFASLGDPGALALTIEDPAQQQTETLPLNMTVVDLP